MQAPRADQHDTSPGPRTPATGRPSPSTSAHRTDQPGLCNADILKYVTVRFRAAEDHFGDVLFHVLAHVASFNSCAFTIIGRHYRATDNIGALRDLMMVKGFTGADITPASVLDEYARVNQLQAQVGLKLWSASFDLKISELEDCIFLMRKSAADLNTAIARLFTNFCPLLERPRVTEAEAKCAMKPIRQRVKDQADGATIWVCEHEVKSAITNLIYVFTPEL